MEVHSNRQYVEIGAKAFLLSVRGFVIDRKQHRSLIDFCINKKVLLRQRKRRTACAAQPSWFCAVGGGVVPLSWPGITLS